MPEDELFGIVPKYLENSENLSKENIEISEDKKERKSLLERARHGLNIIRSQPWSGPVAEVLQLTG